MIVVTGSNVSLHVPEPGSYKKFTWIYGTDQKIVEQDVGNKPEYFKLEGRAHLDDHGTLHIYTVQESDSGTYILQVLDITGVEREWKFLLAVHIQSSGVTWIATWLVGMVPVVLSLLLT
nr:CD48 antigen isoform X2 [Loxodonta africana]